MRCTASFTPAPLATKERRFQLTTPAHPPSNRPPPPTASEANLLSSTPQRIEHNLAGLRETLQLSPAQLARLVRMHPTVLRLAPATMRVRYDMLSGLLGVSRVVWCHQHSEGAFQVAGRSRQQLPCPPYWSLALAVAACSTALAVKRPLPTHTRTQLDEEALRSFLCKVPSVLRLTDGKLAAHMAWLQEVSGASRDRVVRAYLSWPQLATTSRPVLQER